MSQLFLSFQYHRFFLFYLLFPSLYLFWVYFCLASWGRAYIMDLKLLLFLNICIKCYKFIFQHCFWCGPQIFIICTIFFIQFNAFLKIPLTLSLWYMDYLEMCCFISNSWEIFLLPFCYWYPSGFHYGWRTHSAWFQSSLSIWGLLNDPGHDLFGICSMNTWKEYVSWCWQRVCCKNVNRSCWWIVLLCPSLSLLIF